MEYCPGLEHDVPHDDPFQFQKFKASEIPEAWGFFPDSSPEHP